MVSIDLNHVRGLVAFATLRQGQQQRRFIAKVPAIVDQFIELIGGVVLYLDSRAVKVVPLHLNEIEQLFGWDALFERNDL